VYKLVKEATTPAIRKKIASIPSQYSGKKERETALETAAEIVPRKKCYEN